MSLDFAAIKAKHDLTEVVRGYVNLSRDLQAPCPFCGGRNRFYVHRRRQQWSCRHCRDHHGDVIEFVALMESQATGRTVTMGDAARLLEGLPPTGAKRDETRMSWRHPKFQERVQRILLPSTAMLFRPTPTAYLRSRGLEIDLCSRYGLGYHPSWERWGDDGLQGEFPAIVLPYRFADQRVSALRFRFVDRGAVGNDRLRSIKNSQFTLFGTDHCEGASTLIAVEGEFNCLSIRQTLPVDQFDVVSFGGETSTSFLPAFAAQYPKVIVWQDTAAKIARTLHLLHHPNAKGFVSADGKDANDVLRDDPTGILTRIQEAR